MKFIDIPEQQIEINDHIVIVPPFSVGETLVTREEYHGADIDNPNLPVTDVNFFEAQEWAKRFKTRLITEFEWLSLVREEPKDLESFAVIGAREVTTVKSKKPNSLGIYDLFGLAWEWCDTPYDLISIDPDCPRVLRGGSWNNFRGSLACSSRLDHYPYFRFRYDGFRVAKA